MNCRFAQHCRWCACSTPLDLFRAVFAQIVQQVVRIRPDVGMTTNTRWFSCAFLVPRMGRLRAKVVIREQDREERDRMMRAMRRRRNDADNQG